MSPAHGLEVLAIGECMAELSAANDAPERYRLGFGGDTLNTCVHLARILGPGRAGYATRLGDDTLSARMRAAWAEEGIDCARVEIAPGRAVGLYLIETDGAGERRFTYWRDAAPARGLFTEGDVDGLETAIAATPALYFSGVTLAILPEAGRARLIAAAGRARAAGATVAVDPNHRPRLWSAAEAATWLDRAYRVAGIVLTSAEEEQAVFGRFDVDAIRARGVTEVVVKRGAAGAEGWSDAGRAAAPAVAVPRVVDTTGAGDAFDAGYLAARLRGAPLPDALAAGCALGAKAVQWRGAIVARDALDYDGEQTPH